MHYLLLEDHQAPPEARHERFHYAAYQPGQPGARNAAQPLCGQPRADMRRAAPFRVGDKRGAVHYQNGCGTCLDLVAEIAERT